jgi:hypothetical protein
MESLPTGRIELVHCAWPEARVTAEHPLIVSVFVAKLTVPVDEKPPITVAVKVTDWPEVEGLMLEATVVVVVA